MNKSFALIVILSSIILSSCQKEIDWGADGTGSGSNPTNGDLLVKTESKSGSETATTIYTYNAGKKLINEKITGMSQGFNVGNEFRYYRNASNIITHYTQINPNLVLNGIDSVITYVNYDVSSSRYTSYVSEIGLLGFVVRDSTAIIYDGSEKVIRTEQYQKIPLLSGDYEIALNVKYTYDANGNMLQQDFFDVDPVTLAEDPVSIIKYTFDSKVAAINFGKDAYVMGRADVISVNNATKIEFIDIGTPSNSFIINNTYSYNSSNRPVTGVSTRMPGSILSNVSFFYQ